LIHNLTEAETKTLSTIRNIQTSSKFQTSKVQDLIEGDCIWIDNENGVETAYLVTHVFISPTGERKIYLENKKGEYKWMSLTDNAGNPITEVTCITGERQFITEGSHEPHHDFDINPKLGISAHIFN
jgi:hypothetical protein